MSTVTDPRRGPRPASAASRSDEVGLKKRVHHRLVTSGGLTELEGPARDLLVRARLAELLREEAPLLAGARFDRIVTELTDEVSGLGPLEPLLAEPDVDEVMLNGPGRAYVERAGRLEAVVLDLDAEAIVRIVERVVAPLGLRLDRASPMVDARLADGSRVHALIPPLAIDGPCVTIRRFRARAVDLESFGVLGPAAAFLRWAVTAGWNLLISGGTSAGKTTLLNSLSSAIPDGERVVTIEETAELQLARAHVVRLEARPPNAEGAGAVSVRDLVRAALRMRPDRIVVGEVRGGEALDMLQALNTGHDGSLSTVHANGPADVLPRLETLVLLAGVGLPLHAVRAQVASAIDAVVHVARHERGGRRVQAVSELTSVSETPAARPLFTRRDAQLVPVASPVRPARRADAPALDDRWFSC